ncbi:MAG: zinc ribbon domain-containing protein [Promethearchaeota archaeon]
MANIYIPVSGQKYLQLYKTTNMYGIVLICNLIFVFVNYLFISYGNFVSISLDIIVVFLDIIVVFLDIIVVFIKFKLNRVFKELSVENETTLLVQAANKIRISAIVNIIKFIIGFVLSGILIYFSSVLESIIGENYYLLYDPDIIAMLLPLLSAFIIVGIVNFIFYLATFGYEYASWKKIQFFYMSNIQDNFISMKGKSSSKKICIGCGLNMTILLSFIGIFFQISGLLGVSKAFKGLAMEPSIVAPGDLEIRFGQGYGSGRFGSAGYSTGPRPPYGAGKTYYGPGYNQPRSGPGYGIPGQQMPPGDFYNQEPLERSYPDDQSMAGGYGPGPRGPGQPIYPTATQDSNVSPSATTQERRCKFCGAEIPAGGNFCPNCGSEL